MKKKKSIVVFHLLYIFLSYKLYLQFFFFFFCFVHFNGMKTVEKCQWKPQYCFATFFFGRQFKIDVFQKSFMKTYSFLNQHYCMIRNQKEEGKEGSTDVSEIRIFVNEYKKKKNIRKKRRLEKKKKFANLIVFSISTVIKKILTFQLQSFLTVNFFWKKKP